MQKQQQESLGTVRDAKRLRKLAYLAFKEAVENFEKSVNEMSAKRSHATVVDET